MKAALVSATSLAALLAFEVGLDVAIDPPRANAQTFSVENPLNFGNVLLSTIANGTTATAAETVTNGSVSTRNTFTFSSVTTSPFSGSQVTYSVNAKGGTTLHHYSFTPTSIGSYSANGTIQSGSSASPFTLTGNAVAPQASIVISPIYGRIGAGAQTIAAITVSNSGDGDLSSNTALAAQLHGSIGQPSGSVFSQSGSNSSFTLNDSNYTGAGTATTTATFNYVYTPTNRAPNTASLTVSLANGGGNTNTPTASVVTLTGQGVGPAFASTINGTGYANSANVGHNTITVGTISTGAAKTGATATTTITLSNISTDPGSASLTDLTLESFALSGTNANDFSVIGFNTDTVLAEAQSVTVTLDFSGPTVGSYNADLTFTTDEGVALGAAGAMFSYVLAAKIPEPATVVTFAVGLAGLGWARRRRAARNLARA